MKDMTYEEWLELDEIVIPLKPDLWREMEDISLAYAIMVSNNLDPNGYFELKNSCTDWGGSPLQQYYPAWFSERLAVMESAIRTGTLKRTVTDKDHFGNNTVNTRIEMAGFLAWCGDKEFETYNPQQGGNESAVQVKPVARGLTKGAVINAFDGLHYNRDKWSKYLGDPPDWLKDCRLARGNKSTSAMWSPVLIAAALYDKKISINKLDAVFVHLKDWVDEWRETSATFRD